MSTAQRDACGYAGMAVVSLLLLVWIIPAWSPPWPGYGMPPSLVPNVAAGILLALSLWGLARSFLFFRKTRGQRAPMPEGTPKKTRGWLYLLIFVTPCALLMPAMASVGFVPAGIGFMLLIQWLCGQRRPLPLILVSVLPVLTIWALMRFALGVPMP
ncbi:tripartite tricarboxylate transporter TctB family protein [Desulfovibrio sp. ZJ369]|uniref:tripartite tricarboxylate transporter TctB family protein n=1 Tax=Desulfovibrio sp. ZJ369 TaxID=2709793 RepID=UPI0013EC9F89|nr:tripartite tricarboxylate transporter TctB family protein [Desulfovibrio sp. ZJ369]